MYTYITLTYYKYLNIYMYIHIYNIQLPLNNLNYADPLINMWIFINKYSACIFILQIFILTKHGEKFVIH